MNKYSLFIAYPRTLSVQNKDIAYPYLMELFHVYNRGVEKRDIFLDDRDRVRFVHCLYEFNDTAPANNIAHHFQNKDIASPYFEVRAREVLVDIHGWCLMNNHYHLLLSPRRENGVAEFTRKLGIGYTHYFNERHKRSGVLFQGRTKKKLIDRDAYFLYILHYIHLNPLDYLRGTEDWRKRRMSDKYRVLTHLDSYRWSSFQDYCGKKNFPSILSVELFGNVFKNYKSEITAHLKDIDITDISELILE
jgi:putative transposase